MADKKISELTAVTTLTGGEELPLVQSYITKKAQVKNIAKVGYQDVVNESTTTRALSLADIGCYIRSTNASDTTFTVPSNASVAFDIGTVLNGCQAGDGKLTIATSGGVTINKPSTHSTSMRTKFAPWGLVKVGTDTWDLMGDLEAL